MTTLPAGDHQAYMQYALSLARKSPPKPTNYCVGAIIMSEETNAVLATGYTLELPGNTHAEQCCLMKLAEELGVGEKSLKDVLPRNLALYTTMEPCSKRLSGKKPCLERVLQLAGRIQTVYVGVLEPEKFVATNTGIKSLRNAGIEVIHVPGLEEEILAVATAGHEKSHQASFAELNENTEPRVV